MTTRASASSKAKPTTTKKSAAVPKTTPAKVAAKSQARTSRAAAKPTPAKIVKPAAPAAKDAATTAPATELKKSELIAMVVERSGVRKKFAKPAVEAMIEVLGEAIAEGRNLNLQPLGKVLPQRTKETSNARITVARIRQSKSAMAAATSGESDESEKREEMVAAAAE